MFYCFTQYCNQCKNRPYKLLYINKTNVELCSSQVDKGKFNIWILGEENIFLGRKRKTEKEKEESFWRRRIYVLLAEEGKNGEWSIYRCFKGSWRKIGSTQLLRLSALWGRCDQFLKRSFCPFADKVEFKFLKLSEM